MNDSKRLIPKEITQELKQWVLDHIAHPYPTEVEKRDLALKHKLSLQQLNTWLINARRRYLHRCVNSAGNQVYKERIKGRSPSPTKSFSSTLTSTSTPSSSSSSTTALSSRAFSISSSSSFTPSIPFTLPLTPPSISSPPSIPSPPCSFSPSNTLSQPPPSPSEEPQPQPSRLQCLPTRCLDHTSMTLRSPQQQQRGPIVLPISAVPGSARGELPKGVVFVAPFHNQSAPPLHLEKVFAVFNKGIIEMISQKEQDSLKFMADYFMACWCKEEAMKQAESSASRTDETPGGSKAEDADVIV